MKYEFWRSKKSVLLVTQTLLLMVAVILPIAQWNNDVSQQWGSDLQQLNTKRLWLVRAFDILKEHSHVTQALSTGAPTNDETTDSITLSLIEAIKQQAHTEQLELTQLSVTQPDGRQKESEATESSIHALTVKFAVTTDRAMRLLSLFDALANAAGWRPIEVRGCSLARLTASPVSLQATCSVDIYYFPEVHR